MKKIYVTVGSKQDISWLGEEYEETNSIDESDFVLFTGGADISPEIYGDKRNPKTYFNYSRDEYEIGVFRRARNLNKPMIGICRGAQLLCALNGGKLWQDVYHPGHHTIKTKYGTELTCNSLHHQMLNLDNLNKDEYDLIAWAPNISKVKETGSSRIFTDDSYKEPEMVYFNKTNTFVMQYHPEYAPKSDFANFSKVEFEKIYGKP